MNKKLVALSTLTVLLAMPVFVLAVIPPFNPPAAPVSNPGYNPLDIIAIALYFFWAIAIAFVIIMFIIAGFKFITAQGDPSKLNEARQSVIWGVAGVVVILLAWSILEITKFQFGF